jgi:hypothetical protein
VAGTAARSQRAAGVKLYRLCEVVPDRRWLRESEFFRRDMAAEGCHHSECALFWRADTLASEIAIRRTAAQGEFTTQEMAVAASIAPASRDHVATLVGRTTPCGRDVVSARRRVATRHDPGVAELTGAVRSRSRLLALMIPRLSYD